MNDVGKGRKLSPEKELLRALRTPVGGARELVHVMLTLPTALVRVLDTEAGVFGLRRYQFVELLFLSALKEPMIVRPSYMEPYSFTREEIETSERVLIYMRPEVKRLLDDYMKRHWVRPSSWVAAAIRNWAQLGETLSAAK